MHPVLKKYLNHISIRRKLMLLIMAACSVVLLASTVAYLLKETISIVRAQSNDLKSLADIIGKNVAAPLTFNDPQSAMDTMASLKVKGDVIAAYILQQDTTVFSRYLATNSSQSNLPYELPGADYSPESCRRILNQLAKQSHNLIPVNDQVVLVAPIRLDDQEIGTIVLFASTQQLKVRLAVTLLMSVCILCLAFIAAYLLSMRLQQVVSEPIRILSDAMRQVSETKDFSLRVVRPGDDEIGQLCDGFNEMLQEIEERNLILRQRQEHLQELAHFDTLTRLPNRILFHDRLQQAMNLALRNDQLIAIMFLDLDRFKDINDTMGHRIGDLLLQQVAGRMGLALRDCDTVARLGGDEFTIFAQNVKSKENGARLAQKLIDMFEIPYFIEGNHLYVTCSIGVTFFPYDADTMDLLLMNADVAMYHAKSAGKNTYRLYTQDMNQYAGDRVALQTDLRRAINLQQLYLLYQPKLDIASGKITGVEALIRWQHPERGLISPTTFIPLAEENGCIQPITEWVLRTACAQAKRWYDSGLTSLSVAVNISAYCLKRQNIPQVVRQVLEEAGLPPRLLELELTESLLVENDHQAEQVLADLKQIGVTIAIDDFGTGYSSLSYLHRFPIDCLKIDRSFVWNMHRGESDQAIVAAIIAMAHSLNLKVVAEGVETDEHLSALRMCGCDTIQGYLISKPVPADDLGERMLVGHEDTDI